MGADSARLSNHPNAAGAGPGSSPLWPRLELGDWRDTYQTFHLWTQIVGKIRMGCCAPENHWWHVSLSVTSRGLSTGPMQAGRQVFQIDFDLIGHELVITTLEGARCSFALAPYLVAEFYGKTMVALMSLGIEVGINTLPQEMENPIRFESDTQHASYDGDAVNRCFRILALTNAVCHKFGSDFLGKVSPVQFFWGSFDLASTRFSGRRAPEHPGGGLLPAWVTRESYSHEVFSCGWWPGGGPVEYPAFYAYAYPQPAGLPVIDLQTPEAFFCEAAGEFLLPYEAVRQTSNPETLLLQFFREIYVATADLGHWDRNALERQS